MRSPNRLAMVVAIAAVGLLPIGISAQPATVSAELAFRSKYLFAGIPFAAEQVQQAKVTVVAGSFTVNAFSVYDIDASDVTETDIYGDYYFQAAPKVGIFLGGALYRFKYDVWESTPELYGGVVISAPLNPTLFVAHDFDLGDGTHAMLMLSHSVPLGDSGVTLDLAGNVDYNAEYYTTASGLSFVDVSAAIAIPVGPLTVSPMFLIQRRLDDAFLVVPDEELFGVTASFTF